jgi:hypothetical protein
LKANQERAAIYATGLPLDKSESFPDAKQFLNEFLPTLVGQTLADQVLREGPQYFRPDHDVFILLEFADAAYLYGHSQVRTYAKRMGPAALQEKRLIL